MTSTLVPIPPFLLDMQAPPPPRTMIGALAAVGLAILLALLYVLVIYGASLLVTRQRFHDRDYAPVIKARVGGVILFSSLLLAAIYGLGWHSWRPPSLPPILYHLSKTALLLAGLIYIHILQWDIREKFSSFKDLKLRNTKNSLWRPILSRNGSLEYLRDIWVGPLGEEICFRLVIVSILHHVGSFSSRDQIALSSIIFSIAHCHPIFVHNEALLAILMHCLLTFIFGLYAARIFIQTGGSTICCFLVHALCNQVGFPKLETERFGRGKLAGLMAIVILSLGIFCSY